MKKNILAFGFSLPDVEGFETLPITSDRSWLDADIVVVEPSLQLFNTVGTYAGVPKFSESGSFQFRELMLRWKPQLDAALAAGKLVMFYLLNKERYYYYTGETKEAGTPGRPRTINIVAECSNYDLIPGTIKDFKSARGKSMIMDSGASAISSYWKEFGSISSYNGYFDIINSTPLIRTKSGEQFVGCLSQSFGSLLLLPEISWSHLPDEDDDGDDINSEFFGWSKEYIQFSRQFRDAILELDRRFAKDHTPTPPPAWADVPEFRFSIETKVEESILSVEALIEEQSKLRDALRTELHTHGSLRALLYETGEPLEKAVRAALVILGYQAEGFKKGDSEFDALFSSEEGRFLGEVEGKENKPVNIDKLSQLHRNITEDYARDDVTEMAVGVLFGNAFRLKPLELRGQYFTDKVLNVAKTANIALVRTPDLFTVAHAVKEGASDDLAKACREAIRTSAGKIVCFPAVQPYTRQANDVAASPSAPKSKRRRRAPPAPVG